MKDNGHFDDITTREPGHLDGNDPAWQEYEDWLDSRDREEMDEATGFDAAFIAVSPAHYLHEGNLPLPEECQGYDRFRRQLEGVRSTDWRDRQRVLDDATREELEHLVTHLAGDVRMLKDKLRFLGYGEAA